MPAPTTAIIIPFPHPAPDRLHQALTRLEAALTTQREAVATWRAALANLREGVHGLHTSLLTYDARLGALRKNVAALNGEAKRLEAWGEGRPGGAAPWPPARGREAP